MTVMPIVLPVFRGQCRLMPPCAGTLLEGSDGPNSTKEWYRLQRGVQSPTSTKLRSDSETGPDPPAPMDAIDLAGESVVLPRNACPYQLLYPIRGNPIAAFNSSGST